MKALVTGGAGFIGSAITRRLLGEGHEVVVLDDLSTGDEAAIPGEAEFVRGDIRSLEDCLRAAAGCEVVFHQAALPSVPRSIEDPVGTTQVNVVGSVNVLVAARDSGCRRCVYASSSSVYGNPPDALRSESQKPHPESPYAASKLAGEKYARLFSEHLGLSAVSLRYFNIFGPGQTANSPYAAVFPRFISALLNDRAPEVNGDGQQTRDFTFIDDAVEANLLAADAGDDANSAVVNVGSGSPKSVNETLKQISDAVGKWIDPVTAPERAGDVRESLADLKLASQLIGYRPKSDWSDSVRATVEYFREG